jgi:beta-galactosidase
VTGAGKLKAVCNGNAIDQTSFSSNYMRTFNGKMVVLIESTEESGEIGMIVSGGKLNGKEIKISTAEKAE